MTGAPQRYTEVHYFLLALLEERNFERRVILEKIRENNIAMPAPSTVAHNPLRPELLDLVRFFSTAPAPAVKTPPPVPPKSHPVVEDAVVTDTLTKENMESLKKKLLDQEYYPRNEDAPPSKALIINVYSDADKEKIRFGSEKDVTMTQNTLASLGFDTDLLLDPTASEMELGMQKFANDNHHKESDMSILIIMCHGSHGENNEEVLLGRDGRSVPVENVYSIMGGSRAMAGKPKWVVLEYCRGEGFDNGLSSDATVPSGPQLPTRKIGCRDDLFISYSAFRGFASSRSSEYGSPYMIVFNRILQLHAYNLNLMELMTKVNSDMRRLTDRQDGKQVYPASVTEFSAGKLLMLPHTATEDESSKSSDA